MLTNTTHAPAVLVCANCDLVAADPVTLDSCPRCGWRSFELHYGAGPVMDRLRCADHPPAQMVTVDDLQAVIEEASVRHNQGARTRVTSEFARKMALAVVAHLRWITRAGAPAGVARRAGRV